ncbi:unnamed protein product [Chrysodeixis includens]|nr:unnamed protein product [Chrysodeixis includens]
MLFVSLFGCIGALKESTCLVNIFAVILSLVFVLEIAAAIAAYSLRGQVTEMLDVKLRSTLPYYYENDEVHGAFDFIQNRLNCCGVDSYMDWGIVTPPAGISGISINNITVPNSCCAESRYDNIGDVEIYECTKLYANGCLPRVYYLVYQSAGLLGAGAMTIAFIQIIGIVFSFSLASSIRKAKSERERRRWEIQERMINAYTSLNPNQEKQAPVVYVPFHGQTTA